MSPTWFAALALPSLRTASRPMGRAAVSETQDIITQVCVTLALYGESFVYVSQMVDHDEQVSRLPCSQSQSQFWREWFFPLFRRALY